MVLHHALAVLVDDAEVELGAGIALFGKRTPQSQSGRVVALIDGDEPILERSRDRRPSGAYEQDQQQLQQAHGVLLPSVCHTRALSLTIWPSAGLKALPSISELNRLVIANQGDLTSFLRQNTYVVGIPAGSLDENLGSSDVTFDQWNSTANQISFRYRASQRSVVNLAIWNSPYWEGAINGMPTKLISGNYGTISIPVLAGEGQIVLNYRDILSRLYFWSRWVLGALGIIGMGFIMWACRVFPPLVLTTHRA